MPPARCRVHRSRRTRSLSGTPSDTLSDTLSDTPSGKRTFDQTVDELQIPDVVVTNLAKRILGADPFARNLAARNLVANLAAYTAAES